MAALKTGLPLFVVIAVPPIGDRGIFFGEGLAGHEERVSLDLAAGYGPDCTRARA